MSNANNGPNSTSRVQTLQDRLVQLTVDIEDKTKVIELLDDAILEQDKLGKDSLVMEKACYKSEMVKVGSSHKSELSQLLRRCTQVIDKKKEQTADTELLLKREKEEKRLTTNDLEKINLDNNRNVEKAYDTWKSGEKDREASWMAQQLKKVREATVKALDPQVKRLVHSFRLDCERLEAELKSRKNHYTSEARERNCSALSEYKKQSALLSLTTIDSRNLASTKQRSDDRQNHDRNVTTLRASLQSERESQRRLRGEEDFKNTEEHRLAVSAAKSEEDESRTRILQERDKEIDQMIRSFQRQEKTKERAMFQEKEEANKLLIAAHEEDKAKIHWQTTRWKDLRSLSASAVETANREGEELRDRLEVERRRIDELKATLADIRADGTQKESRRSHVIHKIRAEHQLQDIRLRKDVLTDDIKTTFAPHLYSFSKHDARMDELKNRHRETIDELERTVGNTIDLMDEKRETIRRQMRDRDNRIDRVRALLDDYCDT